MVGGGINTQMTRIRGRGAVTAVREAWPVCSGCLEKGGDISPRRDQRPLHGGVEWSLEERVQLQDKTGGVGENGKKN